MKLPALGDEFEGKYKLLETLGEGGFARVYRALDLQVRRDVAIKVLLPGTTGYKPDTVQRFAREARLIAELRHPNTITMFDFGRSEDELLYMVFEYAEGRDLSDELRDKGALPAPTAYHVLEQLLGALSEAHEQHVLHRDIKPANVILHTYMDDPYRVKLIDFGIAKPLVEKLGTPNTLTREGVVVGTPRYMAPEQFFGDKLTPAADVYSLGLLAYEMLVGESAVRGANQGELVRNAVSTLQVEVPAHLASPEFRAFIERMTKRLARDRFSNAGEALEALKRVADPNPRPEGYAMRHESERFSSGYSRSHSSGYSLPSTAVEEEPGQAPRRPLIAGLAVAVFVAALVAAGLWLNRETPVTASPPEPTTRVPSGLVRTEQRMKITSLRDVGVEDKDEEPDMTPQRVSGCGREASTGRILGFTARVGVQRRSWNVYAPRNYDNHRRHPVVLMFHRTSRTGEQIIGNSRFADLAEKHRFVVLAPDALDPSKPWTSNTDHEAVDIAIREMAQEYCLDETLVFAVGDGAGGRFVANLPCHVPMSGIATFVYGQYLGETICVPQTGVVPAIRTYGALDRDVPIKGGSGCMGGRPFIDIEAHNDFWHERHGCTGRAKKMAAKGDGRCETWSCDVPFASCAVNGGHHWPNSTGPPFTMPACRAPIANFALGDAIWAFFAEHGRTLHP